MKRLKLSSVYRTLLNRSQAHLCLLRPLETSQQPYQSSQKPGNDSISTGVRFYCSSVVSTISSQERQTKFEPAIDINEIPNLTDDELFKIIAQLRDAFIHKTNRELKHFNQTSFISAIEKECIRRARQDWDLDKTIDVVDKFYPRCRFLCPNLIFWLLRARFKKAIKSATPTMMKYVTAMEKLQFWNAYHINCYYIELTLIRNLDQYGLPEISALLNIINTRNAKIVNQKLIGDLYDRLIDEIDQVDSRVLNTFILFFSHQQTRMDFSQLLNKLLVKLRESHIVKTEGIAKLCLMRKIYQPEILDHLAQKAIQKLPEISVVELETIITTLAFFNYNSRDIYQQVIDNFAVEPLRTALLEHPKRLVKIIGNLCLIGVYPYNYIDRVLSKEFLQKTFAKKLSYNTVIREVMILDGCVKAECPDYEGNKLDDSLEENLLSRWSSHIHHYLKTDGDTNIVPKPTGHDKIKYEPTPHNKIILDTRRILRDLLGGPEYVHTCYILPFLPRPDLLFGLDRERNPVNVSDQFGNSIRIDYKNLNKCVDWYVIIPVRQHPVLKSENIILGKDIAKERILRKYGFKSITIVPEIWFGWEEDEKKSYLNEFIR